MKRTDEQIQLELKNYFDCARNQKCPPTMEHKLYKQLNLDKKFRIWSPRLVMAGLSFMFVSALVFNISSNHIQQKKLNQAQADLEIAMHYMNRVTFKPLSAVNNKGIKPGLIMPLSRSMASL